MKKSILFSLLLACIMPAFCQEERSDEANRQYTSWSIVAGPNISGYRFSLQATDNAPDRISPATGFDLGSAISYHIMSDWQLRLTALTGLERTKLKQDSETTTLSSLGADIVAQAGYRIELQGTQIQLLAGPYTHFIIASQSSNHIISNPFNRTIANNPRTDNTLFALGEFSAGGAVTIVLQLKSKWMLALDTRWGLTDMLNAESHELYVRPYKVALLAGYSF